jgi:hypothetical protein
MKPNFPPKGLRHPGIVRCWLPELYKKKMMVKRMVQKIFFDAV